MQEAKVVRVFPEGKEIAPNENVVIEFTEKTDVAVVSAVEITENGWRGGPEEGSSKAGRWSSSDGRTFQFAPDEPWKAGSLIAVRLPDSGQSQDETGSPRLYFYLVDDGERHGSREIHIPVMKTANNGTHKIPMHITLPLHGGPFPVMIWVHGGGWNGGTREESTVGKGLFAQHLSEHLGVAVVSVAYRCKGSNGTFTQAMEDVTDAIQYVREHAEEFGFDLQRIGLSGGSAGAPLSALAAQQTPEANLYIGLNGIYDFTGFSQRSGTVPSKHESYRLGDPSPEANSAICQLKRYPPATVLFHGLADKVVPYQQSVRFAEALQAAGGHARCVLFKDTGHGLAKMGIPMEIPILFEIREHIRKVWLNPE